MKVEVIETEKANCNTELIQVGKIYKYHYGCLSGGSVIGMTVYGMCGKSKTVYFVPIVVNETVDRRFVRTWEIHTDTHVFKPGRAPADEGSFFEVFNGTLKLTNE